MVCGGTMMYLVLEMMKQPDLMYTETIQKFIFRLVWRDMQALWIGSGIVFV